MKKVILALFLALFTIPTPANARKVFAELLGQQKGIFSNKVKVTVDFGQNVSFWRPGDMMLVDENGKDIVFNSMVDAMNFMGKLGWEFMQAYVVTEGNQNVYHWLMSKDVNSDDDIKAGFNVRADGIAQAYILTFVKKSVLSNSWDTVKTETKTLTKEEISQIVNEWKSQSNDKVEYDVQVKKDR